jgi:hypothetical protein
MFCETLPKNVYSSFTDDHQKLETNQIPFNIERDKQTEVHPCEGKLFSHQKEGSTDTGQHLDESQRHCPVFRVMCSMSSVINVLKKTIFHRR